MDILRVDTELRFEDWAALVGAARQRVARVGTRAQRIARRVPAMMFAMALVAGATWLARPDSKLVWVAGIALTLVFVVAATIVSSRASRPVEDGAFLGVARFEFDARGVHIERTHSRSSVSWAQVLEIEALPRHVVLWVDASTGYILPSRDLPALAGPEFVATLQAWRTAAGAAERPSSPTGAEAPIVPDAHAVEPGRAAPVRDAPRTPFKELGIVGRLLLLLRVDGMQLAASEIAIALAMIVVLGAWISFDRFLSADELVFAPYAVAGLAWYALGFVGLAWLLWRMSTPRAEFRRVLLVTIGAAPIAIAGALLFDALGRAGMYLVIAAFAAWAMVYFLHALRAITGVVQRRAVAAATLAALAFVTVSHIYLQVSPTVWDYAEDDPDTDAGSNDTAAAANDGDPDAVWARVAALQFGQQARIDAELARITRHASARPEVFFLGFAGNGRQRVFAEEIALAARVVGARYDAADRELRLVNDARDLERWPLATPEALRHALLGIGRLMDAEDVLFLALSSHGGEDGSIEIANAGMVPVGLGADELEEMLRAAKIPRVVVVISACYAGAFVPVIADENATVITAAAADRTSFGCADDRDLTYFGEAFYRDALPGAPTLRDAFEAARRAIAERERREGVEPSLPQARVGTLVEQRLAADAAAAQPGQGR